MKNTLKILILSTVSAAVLAACTKKRDAALPDSEQPTLFAISEFGTVDAEKASFSVASVGERKELGFRESALAVKGGGALAAIDTQALNVPGRLKYMFNGLDLQGEPGQKVQIVFGVTRSSVTAYKVVRDLRSLSIVERNLARPAAALRAETQLARTNDSRVRQKLTAEIASLGRASTATGTFVVPLFRYKIEGYGVLEARKNENRESTSVLELKPTDFPAATHVRISNDPAAKEPVACAAEEKDQCEEVFVADRVNNKLMTAGQLRDDLSITTNLADDTEVLTLLDGESMAIFEVTTMDRLNDSEREIVRSNAGNGRVLRCSNEIRSLGRGAAAKSDDCVIVRRFAYGISYVKPALRQATWDGEAGSNVKYDKVRPNASVGLVRIVRNGEVAPLEGLNGAADPRYYVKLADFKGKEFFFRRTKADSSPTSPIGSGFGGPVLLVKFDFEEDRVVVRRTEQLVEFTRDRRDLDKEEVMAFKATYYRESMVDAAGNKRAIPQYAESDRQHATHALIVWDGSRIPTLYSPLSFYSGENCFSIADTRIKDMDRRPEDGILNFSIDYTVTVAPRLECVTLFNTAQDYDPSGTPIAFSQNVSERVSFRANDGRTDKNYAPAVPFGAQNAMGYGVFTTGKLRPSVNGGLGREGQEDNYAYTHDFRDGRKLTYVVGGLPEAEGRKITVDGEEIDLRELYLGVTRDVVKDWNVALRRAFRGSALERRDDYIELLVNGVDVHAKLGDLDRNFLWYDESLSESNGLGISQNGVNPRSGVSVSDFVIMYTGQFRKVIESYRRNAKIVQAHKDMIAKLQKDAEAELKAAEPALPAAPGAVSSSTTTSAKPDRKNAAMTRVLQLVNSAKTNAAVRTLNTSRFNRLASAGGLNQLLKDLNGAARFRGADLSKSYGRDAFLATIMNRALELGTERTDEDLELIAAQEMLAVFQKQGRLTPAVKVALRKKVGALSARKRLAELTRKFPSCFFPARETLKSEFAKADFKTAMIGFMKNTLAHEMGHSLGLTHNFIGNADPKNFLFEKSDLLPGEEMEKSGDRLTSSVMDYSGVEDELRYHGPGPYDVAALRASYTGRVKKADGSFITSDEIRKAVGGSWTNVNARNLVDAKVVLHGYKYCTDKDVKYTPECNRWDAGRNSLEIVQNIRGSYEESYRLNYTGHDRLAFGLDTASSVLGRAIGSMLDARHFMDELIYKLATGRYDQNAERARCLKSGQSAARCDAVVAELAAQMQTDVNAAVESYKFLLGIIGTPDAAADFADASRFLKVPYQYKEKTKLADGQEAEVTKKGVEIVEARSVGNRMVTDDRVDTVGIEYNKVMAMRILALKGFPHYKYSQLNLAFSYLDFERLLGMQPNQSPIVATMLGILRNDLKPFFSNEHVTFAEVAGAKSNVTQAMRVYTAIAGVIDLDAMVLKDADKFSTLFRTRATVGSAPTDRPSVVKLGSTAGSSQRVVYSALDGALVANALVAEAAQYAPYVANAAALKPNLAKLFVLAMNVAGAPDAEARKTAEAELAKTKEELVKTIKAGGFVESALVDERLNSVIGDMDRATAAVELTTQIVGGLLDENTIALIQKVTELEKASGAEAEKLKGEIASLATARRAELEEVGKLVPLAGLAQAALKELMDAQAGANPQTKMMAKALTMVLAPTDFETKAGYLMNSLDFLSSLTRSTNPEFH